MKSSVLFQESFTDFGVLRKELPLIFSRDDSVAVKLHMGEAGNKYFLKPAVVKPLLDAMKSIGLKPFLFDSPVMYHGSRSTSEQYLETANAHGFGDIGCPIVISDDFVLASTNHLQAEVCKALAESDGMLVLSHVKGHACSGFGAAIKNLGMGAVTPKTKKVIHDGGSPVVVGNCVCCGRCQDYCPAKAIRMADKAVFNLDSCWGCNICVNCCEQRALRVKVASFDRLLAEGAQAVLKTVKKSYFVNVIKDVAQFCDCVGSRNKILGPDLGVLFGSDIVAVDKASMDLINQKAGYDLFLKVNHKSPLEHIREAALLGLGSIDYELVVL